MCAVQWSALLPILKPIPFQILFKKYWLCPGDVTCEREHDIHSHVSPWNGIHANVLLIYFRNESHMPKVDTSSMTRQRFLNISPASRLYHKYNFQMGSK